MDWHAELKDKVILITGASRGIGEAAAIYLADLGAKLVLAARSEDAVDVLAESLPSDAIGVKCDVADPVQVQAAINLAVARFGRLDALVNNAGMLEPVGRLGEFDTDDWDRVIDVNVKGVFYAMNAALPIMAVQGSGVILNISSGAANGVLEGWSHYCASKAAVLQLTRAGALEYGDKGVQVLGFSPGTVATEMQRVIKRSGVNPVSDLEWEDHIPASDAGQAIAFCCTTAAAEFAGGDFAIKTPEGRAKAGLPPRVN